MGQALHDAGAEIEQGIDGLAVMGLGPVLARLPSFIQLGLRMAQVIRSRRPKVVLTVDRHGNTSAASVPLALDTCVREGKIKTGDTVLLAALGGGFAWGAALLTW